VTNVMKTSYSVRPQRQHVARKRRNYNVGVGWESNWGFIVLLALLVPAWWVLVTAPGVVGPLFLFVLSLVDGYYFLFQATLIPCHAETRHGNKCRNNTAGGVLPGCWIYEHKWDRLKMLMRPWRWDELRQRLCSSTRSVLATLGAMATIASGMSSVIALIVKR
jgi:hypothetical protein